MKFTTIYLGNNKIELFNSIIGKETVKVNGDIVSSKFSFAGTEHIFSIKEEGEGEESKMKLVTGFGFNGVVIDLYKNEKPIIESPKSGCLGVFVIVVLVVFLIETLERLF